MATSVAKEKWLADHHGRMQKRLGELAASKESGPPTDENVNAVLRRRPGDRITNYVATPPPLSRSPSQVVVASSPAPVGFCSRERTTRSLLSVLGMVLVSAVLLSLGAF
jgi:hypothetical protein